MSNGLALEYKSAIRGSSRIVAHLLHDFGQRNQTLISLLGFGALKPPSSLSSPFCGQRICFNLIARIIIPTTKNQVRIRIGVMIQPMI